MRAPAMTWLKCQIFVPSPMSEGRSMTAVGCAQKLTGSRDGHRRAPLTHRSLARVQHAHHGQPLLTVAARPVAGAHAVDEVIALGCQRLGRPAAVAVAALELHLIDGQRAL